MFDVLVYVGRFQPCHNGHLQVLASALQKATRVILILGSARRSRNIKNPFSDEERRRMLADAVEETIPGAGGRLIVVPVRDYYDNDRWVAAVKRAVAEVSPSGAKVGLIGHAKDNSSYYLREFPDWLLVLEENHGGISATDLRQLLFEGKEDASDELARQVPEAVTRFLGEFRRGVAFQDLSEEYAHVLAGQATWKSAPYPPIFVTTDAVVRCDDHLLMIRRGGHPGRGQWALPGGFVEQRERLRNAAVRELLEETSLAADPATLRRSLVDQEVFDHPDRSVRGRTITHAFFFDLPGTTRPVVCAADDAAEARWIPISELPSMVTMIFEDHFHIADKFLNIRDLADFPRSG